MVERYSDHSTKVRSTSMSALETFFAFFSMVSFSLFAISNFEPSGSNPLSERFLFLLLVSTLLSFLFRSLQEFRFALCKPLFYFIFFVSFLLYRVVLDFGEIEALKRFTTGTTGGVLFAVSIGISLALSYRSMHESMLISRGFFKLALALTAVTIIVSLGYLTISVVDVLSKLRTDIFLLSDSDGSYQRSGSFMIIYFLSLSFLFVTVILHDKGGVAGVRLFNFLLAIAYVCIAIALMLLSQAVGSNSAFGAVFAVLLLSLGYIRSARSDKFIKRLKSYKFTLLSWTTIQLGMRCILFMLAVIPIGFMVALFLLSLLGLDASVFRVSNFESGAMVPSSVSTRIDVLEHFYEQFLSNPLLGDLRIDAITSGEGTYAHSLPLSLLSHLGVFGLLLFILYVVSTFSAMSRFCNSASEQGDASISGRAIGIYGYLMLAFLLFFASFTAFFSWLPLWFGFGLYGRHVSSVR